MVKVQAKTDVSIGNPTALYAKYMQSPATGLAPFIPGIPLDESAWRSRADRVAAGRHRRDPSAWQEVARDVRVLSERLGVGGDVLGRLDAAHGGDAYFIVTGQQPGALGGPLHTAYKIATAIALAERVEKALGKPVVPLYWCGADDTDFREIRDISLLNVRHQPMTTSIAQAAHRPGMPVGDIALTALQPLWQSLQAFVGKFAGGDHVRSAVDDALGSARDHGEVTASLWTRLFDGRLAVVDGRMPSVRRCAQPVFREYVTREDDIKASVAATGERLRQAGYHAQLALGTDSGVFLMDEGLRKNVAADKRQLLEEAVERAVERCSPGVVLRNLVQDYVFEPVAVILGPAELAYRAQIGPLYDELQVMRPVEVARLGATWLPEAVVAVSASADDIEVLLNDPRGFKTMLYGRSLPSSLDLSLTRLRHDVAHALDAFTKRLGSDLPPKSLKQIRTRLGEVEKRADAVADAVYEAGKKIALQRWPVLANLEHVIRPGDRLQERALSGLIPFLEVGPAATAGLIDIAGEHLDVLMDDRAAHIVYSCGS